jgi:hypothetical protein
MSAANYQAGQVVPVLNAAVIADLSSQHQRRAIGNLTPSLTEAT